MATVRQPISRLPVVESIPADALVPALENPDLQPPDRRTVAVTIETLGGAVAQAAIQSLLVRVSLFVNILPNDGEILDKIYFPERIRFPQDMVNSLAFAIDAPGSEAVFAILKDDFQFATVTFEAASNVGVVDGDEITIDPGEALVIVSPDPSDGALGGVSITLAGGIVAT